MMGRNLPRQIRQIELYEKTIGIIGLGAIGLCMAKMAAGFGMKVIAYNHHKRRVRSMILSSRFRLMSSLAEPM